jgi:serine/threonine-protein phosphatase 5
MLWADPMAAPGRAQSKRGVGLCFGPDVTKNFLEMNNLQLVIRSHEMKDEGYEVEHDGKLITVFSAPNYCDQMGNKGGLVRLTMGEDGNIKYTLESFEAVPHPFKPAMCYANKMLFGPNLFGQPSSS